MATFTNTATLSYNGNIVSSNTVTGELQEVLSASKTALSETYTVGDTLTYVVSIVNSGTVPLTGITVTDNLGAYTFNTANLVPLTYVEDSVRYFAGGLLQATPAVTVVDGNLVITGITVPAASNAAIIYQATANTFAPLGESSIIENIVSLTGAGLATPVIATETVTASSEANLTINKAISPSVITENGQLTYTFTIENYGSTPTVITDEVVLRDTFNPILDPITVTYNGITWTDGTQYTYDTSTGIFTTTAGAITVGPATYTQSADGTWTITPGVGTLIVTGTV